ncbi:hypothetical protein FHX15_005982 [Rhizobium sp. BK650]|nr:hypothetical protein [Rhizobium sp. BK650]
MHLSLVHSVATGIEIASDGDEIVVMPSIGVPRP